MVEWKLQNIREGETTSVPVDSKRVAFILISSDGSIRAEKNKGGKLALLNQYQKGDILLAAWPGEWSQDIFKLEPKQVKLS